MSEILSTKCSRKIMREEKNNQYFQITLKFVKWHYVRIAMIAVFQKELCPGSHVSVSYGRYVRSISNLI